VASGVIAGFGTQGYGLALRRLAKLIDEAEPAAAVDPAPALDSMRQP